ncbi:electron transporter [Methylobacterium sp. NEAU 140]|uniref:electron transporter n=1 Tax=Methylobacterium sp. NEAU 140 TaxID=3064945 RepID=UPI0027374101|nr:electron transporter [Methylobacterium sp. NEAU 140]MDP4025569.1 electron transporter [Methylobacterium sp. NEAU 140]
MRLVGRLSSPAAGRILAAALVILGCGVAPAGARLVRADLDRVGVEPGPGARAPLDLGLTDAGSERPTTLGQALGGRPALLLPVDYTCGNVCDPMVTLSAAALAATGLPAADRGLVLVGIDPRDDAAAARRLLADTLGDGTGPVRALVADRDAVTRLTAALGYRFAYDPGTDSFAHPAAALLLTGDGRVSRVLSPLALNGRDLRLALTEAGDGRVGTLADRLTLLCYGYDAASGVYTPLVRRILTVAGIATILGIGGLVLLLIRVSHRRARDAAG